MTVLHKEARLRWAKKHPDLSADDWSIVVISDASTICVGVGDDQRKIRLKIAKLKEKLKTIPIFILCYRIQ